MTISLMPNASAGTVGAAYDIQPSGTVFAVPATLTITYDPASLGDIDPTSLSIGTVVDGSWLALPSAVNTTADQVQAALAHLSPYGLISADQGGVPLATLVSGCVSGDPLLGTTPTNGPYYFNFGNMRLVNSRWGSDGLNCTSTTQSACINSDRSVGWNFNRQSCGGFHTQPDFPDVEFGLAPYIDEISYSSTTLLPIQLGGLQNASVTISNFVTNYTSTSSPRPNYTENSILFEISQVDPRTNAAAIPYAYVYLVLSYEADQLDQTAGGWTCKDLGDAGSFTLCLQDDHGSEGREFLFFNLANAGSGSQSFTGTVDIKQILNWIVSTYPDSTVSAGAGAGSFNASMYLTRIAVGTMVDDNTGGSAKLGTLAFQINGMSRSIQLGN